MKKNTKTTIFIFLFHFLFWLGFTYLTRDDEQWKWIRNALISLGYAVPMTYMYSQQMKNHQLYLAAGQGEGLIKYLIEEGYIEKKKKDNATYFKKTGWSFKPFTYTVITESAFYTLLVASDHIIENVPEHLERIRQPHTV